MKRQRVNQCTHKRQKPVLDFIAVPTPEHQCQPPGRKPRIHHYSTPKIRPLDITGGKTSKKTLAMFDMYEQLKQECIQPIETMANNYCLLCNIALGVNNPRQLCCVTYCANKGETTLAS